MKHVTFACAFFAAFATGWSAESAAAAAERPIELPKFVVTDSRELPPPESWRYATMPGFEILSNAPDKATQRLIRDFSMFRQALGYVWKVPDAPSRPTALIICGRGAKFDAFIPDGKYDAGTARASLFLKNRDQTAIVIDLQATTLNVLSDEVDDPATGVNSNEVVVEHDKQLYREYVHFLLSKAEPRLGAWFEEGLCQIIMRMKFDRRYIEFAKIEPYNTVSAQAAMTAGMNATIAADDPDATLLAAAPAEDRDFNAALAQRALVPLEKFFSVQHDSPEALNPLGNNRWAKQAYAFVHMCLYGRGGRFQKAFSTFLVRSARERVTESLFKECFNMTYARMLDELRGYIEFTDYETKVYRSKQDAIVPPPPLALRDATQSEIGRIKGETILLAGHTAAARTELIAPYIRGERDPQLLASLGLFEHSAGEDDRARKFLQASVDGRVPRPDAYLELARLKYADASASPAAPDGKFSPEQTRAVINLVTAAHTQPPPLAALYELAADTWTRSAVTPGRDDVGVLIEGVRLFPSRLRLVYQTASLCADAGMIPQAHALAGHGLGVAPDAPTRARFEALKAALPPEPAAPARAGK
jgi:hypothetical protein